MRTRTDLDALQYASRRHGRLRGWLFDHPADVGETYPQHAGIAVRFGITMIAGGAKCLIHAVLPAFHQRAASDTVRRLHRQLEQRRAKSEVEPDYVI